MNTYLPHGTKAPCSALTVFWVFLYLLEFSYLFLAKSRVIGFHGLNSHLDERTLICSRLINFVEIYIFSCPNSFNETKKLPGGLVLRNFTSSKKSILFGFYLFSTIFHLCLGTNRNKVRSRLVGPVPPGL